MSVSSPTNRNSSRLMKYIESPQLQEKVTNAIIGREIGISILNGKCEVFSFQNNGYSYSPSEGQLDTIFPSKELHGNNLSSNVQTTSIFKAVTSTMESSTSANLNANNNPQIMTSSGEYLPPWEPPGLRMPSNSIRGRSNSNASVDSKVTRSRVTPVPLRRRASSLGDINKPSTRRLLVDLILTLNNSFPDFDFATTKPEQFHIIQNLQQVMQTVNSYLAEIEVENPNFLTRMWMAIDEVINIKKCDIFTYKPLMDEYEDPLYDNALWSFNYFFYNEELQRICYFTCVAENKYSPRGIHEMIYGDDDDDDDDDFDLSNAQDTNNDDEDEYTRMNVDTDDDMDENSNSDFDGII